MNCNSLKKEFLVCGGVISASFYNIEYKIDPKKPVDCEWLFTAPPGYYVSLKQLKIELPTSELCQESYLEVKTDNSSGSKQCDSIAFQTYRGQNITVRLRYRPQEDADEFDDILAGTLKSEMTLRILSHTIIDGYPKSPIIQSPKFSQSMARPYIWNLQAKKNNSIILIRFDKLNIADAYPNRILSMQGLDCRGNSSGCSNHLCSVRAVTGYVEEGETGPQYCFPSQTVTVVYAHYKSSNYFRFNWKEVTESEYRQMTIGKELDSAASESKFSLL